MPSAWMYDRRKPLPVGWRYEPLGYEFGEELGRGGRALVYRGTAPDGAEVILKEYFPIGAERDANLRVSLLSGSEAEERRRFWQEALNLISAPGAGAEDLDYAFDANGTRYLAMASPVGVPLLSWVRRQSRKPVEVRSAALLSVWESGLSALEKLADVELVHGDIAPPNVLVAPEEDRLLLIDLGSTYHRLDQGLWRREAHPEYAPAAEAVERLGFDGWLDVFGLAATFYRALAGRPPLTVDGAPASGWRELLMERVQPGGRAYFDGVDRIAAVLTQALDLKKDRALSIDEARKLFSAGGSVDRAPIRRSKRRLVGLAAASAPRFQTCLLQSFDTPRFLREKDNWLCDRNGRLIEPSYQDGFGQARGEAVLNICFGREILVPAGQIADSPAFEAIFREVSAAFAPRRKCIAKACGRSGLPAYLPFRLGVTNPKERDYPDFARAYKYTGADMVALRANGDDGELQKKTGELLEMAAGLFVAREFEMLGKLIEEATGRQDFATLARAVHNHFDAPATIHAIPAARDIAETAYASFIQSRVGGEAQRERLSEDFRETLEAIERVERTLANKGNTGYRGNWYAFRKDFGRQWQVARALLDFRLHLNFAHIFHVDHPILISQAVETSAFEHSLFLGPQFAAEVDPELVGAGPEGPFPMLAQTFGGKVNWPALFELFEDDVFLDSVNAINHCYVSRGRANARYVDSVQEHGALLARRAHDFLDPTIDAEAFFLTTAEDIQTAAAHSTFEPMIQPSALKDACTYASVTDGIDAIQPNLAQAALARIGEALAEQMLYYYCKPYRSMANRAL